MNQTQGTENQVGEDQKIKVHIPPELEYAYRNFFNIYAGPEEVLIEFGNQHRSVPGTAAISDRIVLSYGNAHKLQNALTKMLEEVRKKFEAAKENT